MPLFEVDAQESLVPFRQLHGGAGLYEKEIEDLLWANADDFTGESLFRVARQPHLSGGGIPDIVALDRSARVVVIEVKRDVDRGQLAQCLEYAGWARTTSLDELAGMYHRGSRSFFADWQAFTESDAPIVIDRSPRLMLVARDFHGRTGSAFDFLIDNDLPVKVIRVSVYEDQQGRRFVDVEGEHEPDFAADKAVEGAVGTVDHTKLDGRRIRVADLLDAGLLRASQTLVWDRPRLGQRYSAEVLENGSIRLEDGRAYSSPSRAAMEAADIPSYDGWYAWRVDGLEGPTLQDLRLQLVNHHDIVDAS
jgi:hypothetical protein